MSAVRLTRKTKRALSLLQTPAPGWQDGYAPGILDNWPTAPPEQGDTQRQPRINWTTGRALERHGLATIMAPFAKGWRYGIELTAQGKAT